MIQLQYADGWQTFLASFLCHCSWPGRPDENFNRSVLEIQAMMSLLYRLALILILLSLKLRYPKIFLLLANPVRSLISSASRTFKTCLWRLTTRQYVDADPSDSVHNHSPTSSSTLCVLIDGTAIRGAPGTGNTASSLSCETAPSTSATDAPFKTAYPISFASALLNEVILLRTSGCARDGGCNTLPDIASQIL